MKDIRLILQKINQNNPVNESVSSKLKFLAALAASGGIAVAGANKVINMKHKRGQEIPAQTQQTPPQTPQTQQTPAQTQQTQQTATKTPTYADDAIREMVMKNEGLRLKTYKDTRGIRTIGVGHNLEAPDSQNVFIKTFGAAGKQLHTNCLNGVCGLTEEEAKRLFDADYVKHRNQAVAYFPNLHIYPSDVQSMLVDATYRGDPGKNFRKLVEHAETSKTTEEWATRWEAAAAEYMNRKEFNNPKLNKDGTPVAPGVITRLKEHKGILDGFVRSLRTKNQTIKYPNAPVPATRQPLGESCGCGMKKIKSRIRNKILKKLEEARLDLNRVPRTHGDWNPDNVIDLGPNAGTALKSIDSLAGGPGPRERRVPSTTTRSKSEQLKLDDYEKTTTVGKNGRITTHYKQRTFNSIPSHESDFSIHSQENKYGDHTHWVTDAFGRVTGVYGTENPYIDEPGGRGIAWSRGAHFIEDIARPVGREQPLQSNARAWNILKDIGVYHMHPDGSMPHYGPNIEENRREHAFWGNITTKSPQDIIFDHLLHLHDTGHSIPGAPMD